MAAGNLVVVADPDTIVLGGIMASAADLFARAAPRRAGEAPAEADDGRAAHQTAALAKMPRRSAGAPGRRRDPMIVLSGAALVLPTDPFDRHARHRQRTDRQIRSAAPPSGQPNPVSAPRCLSRPLHRAGFIDVPCTASRASTRSTCGPGRATAVGRHRRAPAAPRRHRLLSDDGRARRRRCGACSIRCGGARIAGAARRRRAAAHLESNSSIPSTAGAQPQAACAARRP